MTIINKVGLEAEFFVTDINGELLFPNDYGFQSDEFIILGEFRALPGETRIETVTNFMKEWYAINELAKKKDLFIDIDPYKEVDLDFWSTILKKQGTKSITQSENIYNLDITKDSDAIIKRGKIVGHRLSIGLHIHFSSTVTETHHYDTDERHVYLPANLPVFSRDTNVATFELNLYSRTGTIDAEEKKVSATVSRITKPVLWNIIEGLDEELFPKYKPDVKLKFRKVGFYELKGYGGFEYRSLPFNEAILDNIYDIVDYSFGLLENLDL